MNAVLICAIFAPLTLTTAHYTECKERALVSGSTHHVSDNQLSASSVWTDSRNSPDYSARRSRLNSRESNGLIGSWSARTNSDGQWIQVDFKRKHSITAIATRGRRSGHWQWVTSYELRYSDDGRSWKIYREGGVIKIFGGNWDTDTINKHGLSNPFVARYVRLYPKTWHNHISLRWEIFGCPLVCNERALISGSSYHVSDNQLSASSSYGGYDHSARRSRLNSRQIEPVQAGAWCAGTNNVGEWIQVDFIKKHFVTAIATRGRDSHDMQWVTSYELRYSDDGWTWMVYKEGCTIKILRGNWDTDTIYKHGLSNPFVTRYVRLYPKTWHNHISLRWEIFGCPLGH